MKTIIIVCSLLAFAYVLAERCASVNDCADTVCGVNASHIECDHHYCTCVLDSLSCSNRDDCNNLGRCAKRDEEFHCIDGTCRCLKN
uniref:Serine protease inhibitor Cvsi-2-like n=1 Tax=Crassostrea virginica TaxID=6565 RepID=A0A8B8AT27_CRAVI|nr:serine protease inhibitor Cvsi-2-like [Crassostrea virginica]